MAYSSAAIAAKYNTAATAGMPCFVGKNGLVDYNNSAEWRTAKTWAAGSDATASGFPTRRAHDLYNNAVTKPNANQTAWYLLLDLNDITFDTIVYSNFDIGTTTATADVDFWIANDNAFTTAAVAVSQLNVTAGTGVLQRYVGLLATKYSNVQWAALEINYGGGDSLTPSIGEVWVGERHQFQVYPFLPYHSGRDGIGRTTSFHGQRGAQVGQWTSDNGLISVYRKYSGQQIIEMSLPINATDDRIEHEDLMIDTDYFTKPFIAIPDPNESPSDRGIEAGRGYIVQADDPGAACVHRNIGPVDQRWTLQATETGGVFGKDEGM